MILPYIHKFYFVDLLASFFPPSPALEPIQIQFRPGPRVPNQLMRRWWATVPEEIPEGSVE
jgi:hypothetical protein